MCRYDRGQGGQERKEPLDGEYVPVDTCVNSVLGVEVLLLTSPRLTSPRLTSPHLTSTTCLTSPHLTRSPHQVELSEEFKANYERWLQREVYQAQTDWDQLLQPNHL